MRKLEIDFLTSGDFALAGRDVLRVSTAAEKLLSLCKHFNSKSSRSRRRCRQISLLKSGEGRGKTLSPWRRQIVKLSLGHFKLN